MIGTYWRHIPAVERVSVVGCWVLGAISILATCLSPSGWFLANTLPAIVLYCLGFPISSGTVVVGTELRHRRAQLVFRGAAKKLVFRWLNRRSQHHSKTRAEFFRYMDRFPPAVPSKLTDLIAMLRAR